MEERLSRIEQRLDRLVELMGLPSEADLRGTEQVERSSVVLVPRLAVGREYRSATTIMGLPLVHIATGVDPSTWRPRVAKGWIAIGNVAIGGLAVGAIAVGGICFGGLSVGVVAIGGAALGVVGLGGSVIGWVAIGGAALGYWALGGGAAGAHVISATHRDADAVAFFGRYLPGIIESLTRPRG